MKYGKRYTYYSYYIEYINKSFLIKMYDCSKSKRLIKLQ